MSPEPLSLHCITSLLPCIEQIGLRMNWPLNKWTNKWTLSDILRPSNPECTCEPTSVFIMKDTTFRDVKLPKLQGITNIEQWSDIITSAFMTYNVDMIIFEPELKSIMKKPEDLIKKECESKKSWWLKSNKTWDLIITSLIHYIITELDGSEHFQTIEPHELWQIIQSHYQKKNWIQKWVIVAKMKVLQLKNSDNIRFYTAEIHSILHELKQYDITVENALTLTAESIAVWIEFICLKYKSEITWSDHHVCSQRSSLKYETRAWLNCSEQEVFLCKCSMLKRWQIQQRMKQ